MRSRTSPSISIIGHCNLQVPTNTATDIITAYGPRIQHVHLHDNKGGYAESPPSARHRNVDFINPLKALQAWNLRRHDYVEVFSEDRQFLSYSRDVLIKTWDKIKERGSLHGRSFPLELSSGSLALRLS
jgi:sugar phosphate isomerase/epimerase